MGGAANPGRNHFLYNITWEEWTSTNGSARWVSVLLSYTRGWATGAARQDINGVVRPVLDAMWAQAQAGGLQLLALAQGVQQAEGVLGWLQNTQFPGDLYEFTVVRGGTIRQQLSAELQLRAKLHHLVLSTEYHVFGVGA